MSEFTVLIDLDSTIYDLLTPWVAWYNKHYNDTFKVSDIDRWSWHEIIKPECGVKLYSFLNKKGLFISLNPYPYALDSIAEVHKRGIKQIFCSTIIGHTGAIEKQEAIERDFPYLGKKALVLVGKDKSLVRGDVLVDDGPHNLEAFREVGGYTVLVKMDKATYGRFPEADSIMTNWKEYPEIISNLMRKNG